MLLIDSLTGGGAERVLSKLATRFSENGYEVQLALTLSAVQKVSPSSAVSIVHLADRPLPFAGITERPRFLISSALLALSYCIRFGVVQCIREGGPAALFQDIKLLRRSSRRLSEHIVEWKPECIISFLPNSNLIAMLAAREGQFKTPILCSDRNHLSSELPRLPHATARAYATRRLYPFAFKHVAVTPGVGEDLIQNFGIDQNRVDTVINGVDISDITRRAQETVPPAAPKETLELVAVGRLSEQKGFDLLLHALAASGCDNCKLRILGEGEAQPELEGLCTTLGISDRVIFAGWQRNPYPWLLRADIFVLSSRWEGMPNAMLEAMALGLPVIATDCPTGPSILLDNGKAGILVVNGSVSEMARAIATLINSEDDRKKYGRLARAQAEKYEFNHTYAKYQSLVEQAIESSS